MNWNDVITKFFGFLWDIVVAFIEMLVEGLVSLTDKFLSMIGTNLVLVMLSVVMGVVMVVAWRGTRS